MTKTIADTIYEARNNGVTGEAAVLSVLDTTSLSITSTGSVVSRPYADRFAEVANILDYKLATETNYNNAMTRALATSQVIVFPYNGGTEYILTATFTVPSNTTITSIGGRAKLKTTGNSQRLFNMTGVSNVRIKDLIIDGDKGSKGGSNRCIQVTNSTDVVIQNIKLTNSTQCIKIDGGSSECKVLDCELTGIDLHGVYLDNPTTNKIDVRNNLLQCGGFGIYLGDGTYKNNIVGNRCYSNGLELIGVTLNCYGNRVADNHAEGTGDNGISITGYQNTVTGNVSVNNANNGICVYGHSNTVTGNVCANNCQSFGTLGLNFAGIMVNPAWGGQGRDNAISGNVCYDDQVSPTQGYGVRVHTHSYIQWATGVTVASMSSNTYRYYGTNVYKISSSNVGTTTGVTPPTHTSGDASDGAVLWTFLFSASVAGNLDSYHNAAGLNTCYGNRVANDSDGTTNANAGIRPGQVVLPINSPTNFVSRIHTHNGAPAGNIVGGTGDLMLRVGGGTGITAYLKESGTNDSTGWVAIMTRKQGTTANRPTLGSGYEGYIYFDTTLGKPIWFKNPTWVLADGTTA